MEREREGETQGFPPGHSPAFAATGVRSAWWTPAWNLTFSTTRPACPGWRCGCTCGFPRRPPGPSRPAPFPPHPATSSPWKFASRGRAAPRGARGSRSLLPPQVSLPPPQLSRRRLRLRLRRLLPDPARAVTAAARLRLRPRLAQRGWGCERHLHRSQLPFAPQISLRPKSHGPHLGLLMRRWGVTSSHLPPPSPPGLEANLTPPLAAGASLGPPHWVGWRLLGLGERQEVDNFVLPPVSFSPFSRLMQQLPPKCPPGEESFISLSGAKPTGS